MVVFLTILTGCSAVVDATSDIVTGIVEWREYSFLGITNSDIAGFTWVFRLIGAIFLLFWFFTDGDNSEKWLLGFVLLGLVAFAPDLLKAFGQLLFPGNLNPSWIQETTKFDSTTSLAVTLLFPTVHQAVEGLVILMILVNSLSATIGKNLQSFIWGASWMIGWLLTPTLYSITVVVTGGLTNFDGLLGGIIETAIPVNTIYVSLTVLSWIIGYTVIPLIVITQYRSRVKVKAGKTEKQKRKTDWEALLALGGGYIGSRIGKNSGDWPDSGQEYPNSGGNGPRPFSGGSNPIPGMEKNPDYGLPALPARTSGSSPQKTTNNIQSGEAEKTAPVEQSGMPDKTIIINTAGWKKSTPVSDPGHPETLTESNAPNTMTQEEFETRFPKREKRRPPGSTAQKIGDLSQTAATLAAATGHLHVAAAAKAVNTAANAVKNGQISAAESVPKTLSQEEFEQRFPGNGKGG